MTIVTAPTYPTPESTKQKLTATYGIPYEQVLAGTPLPEEQTAFPKDATSQAVSQAVGEPVTKVQEAKKGSNIISQVYEGQSGNIYEYFPPTSTLVGYGNLNNQFQGNIVVNAGNMNLGLSKGVSEKVGGTPESFKNLMFTEELRSAFRNVPVEKTYPVQASKFFAEYVTGVGVGNVIMAGTTGISAGVSSVLPDVFKWAYTKETLATTLKPIVVGIGSVTTAYGSYEAFGGYFDYQATKSPESIGRIITGTLTAVSGGLLIYGGWKMPTVWSSTKWKPTEVKFEGSSKSYTVGTSDFEKNVRMGKTVTDFYQKGTRTTWFGLRKQEFAIRGFSEGDWAGQFTSDFTYGTSWSDSVVRTRETLFGRFLKEGYEYPSQLSLTKSYVLPKEIAMEKTTTGKSFEEYLKGYTIKEVRNELFDQTTQAQSFGRINTRTKEIKLDIAHMESALESDLRQGTTFAYGYKDMASFKDFVLKHEIIHTLIPDSEMVDKGYSMDTRTFANNFQFEKHGSISFGGEPKIQEKIFTVYKETQTATFNLADIKTNLFSFKGENVIIGSDFRVWTEKPTTTYDTGKGTVTMFDFNTEGKEFVFTRTQSTTKGEALVFIFNKGVVVDAKPIGTFSSWEESIIRSPVISSGSGGLATTNIPTDTTKVLGFGGSATSMFETGQGVLGQFEGLRKFGLAGGVFGSAVGSTLATYPEYQTYIYPPVSATRYNVVLLRESMTSTTLDIGKTTALSSMTGSSSALSLGGASALGSASSLSLGSGTASAQGQAVSMASAQGLLQGLQSSLSFNFDMFQVPIFTFGGGFSDIAERKTRKKRKGKGYVVDVGLGGSPISDLANITITEAGLLSLGRTPKATLLTGSKARRYFEKSAGLNIPTVEQTSGRLNVPSLLKGGRKIKIF